MAYILREDERYYWHNVNEKTEACRFILGHPQIAHICSQCLMVPSDRDANLIQYVTASLSEFGQQSPHRGKEDASLAHTQGFYLLAMMRTGRDATFMC